MAVLGCWVTDFLVVTIIILYVCYKRRVAALKKKYPFINKKITFRRFFNIITGKESFINVFNSFYDDVKQDGVGGVYDIFGKPLVIITKPDYIRDITTKDFSSFHNRRALYDDKQDPYSANLINLTGERWKTIRSKLSPTFSTGKTKVMFPLIYECAQELKDCIQAKIKERNGSIEMKSVLIRFSTDVIGTCAFGIQCHSHDNSTNEFYSASRQIFQTSFGGILRQLLLQSFPKLASVLTFERQFPEAVSFFRGTLERTIKYRRENKVERNDFVQLMMKINEADADEFSLEVMVANTIIFFFAGLDNTALPISFALHEMARNPDLQEKVYQEIRTVLQQHNGELSYEALGKMDLVKRVVDETLRMYTPTGFLMRKQNADTYKLPGTDIILKKGITIFIPSQCIHRDPDHFPNPDKFDPDRFTEEEKQKQQPYTYLPFGEGPRFCIASRFALLVVRLCFAEMIRHFRFEFAPETDVNLELDPGNFVPTPKKGFWLAVSERNNK